HAKDPARCFFLGTVFAAGIVAFFLALGAVIAGLRGAFDWGQMFSYWPVNLGIGLVILIMGLGMFNMFSIRLPQVAYMFNPQSDSAGGSFLMGVFTAILSTPCTGPLLGAAIAWVLTQSWVLALVIFLAMGVGMAFPYVLLTAVPKWLDKLPRTGPGSELVKQVMGMLMIAVSVYFIGIAITAMAGPGGGSGAAPESAVTVTDDAPSA
ncbi:MAG: cytochrome c biogenesis protein CcdA, partial [Planctomycetota bacterium]